MQYVSQLPCVSVPNLAKCTCGACVDISGTHAFSCRHNTGRAQRHHYVNGLIWCSLTRAGIPSVKEPPGLTRSEGKRLDGLTSIPWREGRSVTWDVTVTNTVAASYVAIILQPAPPLSPKPQHSAKKSNRPMLK